MPRTAPRDFEAATKPAASPSPPPESTAVHSGTVLLVDDNEDVRRAGKRMLESRGFEVELAEDGQVALSIVETCRFDVLVVDLIMPRMDGRQLLRSVRRRMPRQPIVLVSGYGAQLVDGAISSDPHTLFLAKPYRSKDLAAAIAEVTGAKEAPRPRKSAVRRRRDGVKRPSARVDPP